MSSLLASPTARRHHLSPVKPSRISRKTCGVEARNNACVTPHRASKRSASDENAEPFSVSPQKRAKQLSIAASTKPKRAFGALFDVTNVRKNDKCGPGVLEKTPKTLKPVRTILKLKKTPPRPRAPSPKLAFRGLKRAYSPPRFKRVDPPSSLLTASPTSLNSLLASLSKPQEPELIANNIPETWKFDIYEDTPEEMLQNLMEHSTHTLDISDDSDADSDASELQEKGKENIPPLRLAELLSIPTGERANAMRVDVAEKPRRDVRARMARREALREMRKEELPLLEEQKEMKIPQLRSESFFEFKAPAKKEVVVEEKKVVTVTPPSPGFVIWESDHEKEASEDEEEDEVERAAKVPLPPSELDFELESGFEVDADSLCGGSDREQ